jgi:hypothetical protein
MFPTNPTIVAANMVIARPTEALMIVPLAFLVASGSP